LIVILSSRARAVLVLLVGATITCAAPLQAADEPLETKPYPAALDTTYRQRVSSSPYNRPIKTGSLVLPQTAAWGLGPFLASSGRTRLGYSHRDQARIIWQVLPESDKHRQYLQKRRELPRGDWRKLVKWCEQNKLDTLVEYELRRQLAGMRDHRKAGYKLILAQWIPYAEKRQVSYTFPLPVKGVWSVLVDRTKHHRANAFTAFAMDLLIRKKGKHYSDDHKQNSDHYAWAQPVYAQADGVVQRANNQYDDMPAGTRGSVRKANNVVIDYGAGILALYTHLQKGSVSVKAGDRVTAGQEIARIGNSGYSGHPHLHFAMMDSSGFSIKGRYKFQQRIGRGSWRQIDADDMKEGTDIRPILSSSPKSRPATTQPKSAKRSPQQLAASQLRLARAYLSYPKVTKAKALLETIIKDYPTTPAAAEARKELEKLK
jgi:hypothetical protein